MNFQNVFFPGIMRFSTFPMIIFYLDTRMRIISFLFYLFIFYFQIILKLCVRGTVFGRMSPEQKQQLIETLQDLG